MKTLFTRRTMQKHASKRIGSATLVLLAAIVFCSSVAAQTLSTVHSFTGDEGREISGVVQGTDGAFYGLNYTGDLVRINSAEALSILPGASSYNAGPGPGVPIQTSDGAFWATTSDCTQNCGQIVRFNSTGAYEVVYSFSGGSDGQFPQALTVSSSGDLYGVTAKGGNVNSEGTIFKISQAGNYTQLHIFTAASEGGYPTSALVQASDGNFYGTTPQGGPGGKGTIFRISPTGQFTVLHSFQGNDGDTPQSRLWEASPGLLIGSTFTGGTGGDSCGTGCGTLFSITTSGQFRTIFYFQNNEHGAGPDDNLFQASDGLLYGSTSPSNGGRSVDCSSQANIAACNGSIFSVTADGELKTLYTPSPPHARQPGGFLQSAAGDFWGTTDTSGDPAFGPTLSGATVEVFTPSPYLTEGPVQLSFNKKIVRPNTAATLHWEVTNAASLTMQQCFATIQAPSTGGGTWTGMQTGTSDGHVYSGSASIVPTVVGTYTYTLTCGGIETGFASLNVGIPPPLVFKTTSLPNGTLGTSYGPVGLQATGGDGEFHWSLLSSNLPPGLTLSDGGAIQGIPNQAGVYDFTVQVADGESPAITASIPLRITVAAGVPTLSVQANSTHILPGGNVTVNATLSGVANGPRPGGSVIFTSTGSSLSQTVTLSASGQASVSGNFFANSGTYTIAAAYGGDGNYQAVTATTQLLVADSSTTTLSSSLNPSMYGQDVTFTASVLQPGITGTPEGLVTFRDGANTLGISQLSGGRASLTATVLTVGRHIITADYAGGANATPSTSPTLLQTVTPIGLTLGLTASPNSAREGDTVNLLLTLAASGKVFPAGGTASFFDGTALLGTLPAVNTSVVLPVKGLTLGSHTITATYSSPGNGVGLNVASVKVDVLQSDFSLSSSGTRLDVPRTGYGAVTLTLTPVGLYDQRIHMSCSSLPVNALCAFDEDWTAPLSQGPQKIKLVVNADLLLEYGPKGTVSRVELWNLGKGALAAGLFCFGLRRRRLVSLIAFVVCVGLGIQGCGSKEPAFTPAGDYTITVVAQDGMGRSHTVPLVLHVQ